MKIGPTAQASFIVTVQLTLDELGEILARAIRNGDRVVKMETKAFDGARVWQAALGELQLQMTSATYHTWLSDTRWVATDTDSETLIIAVKNGYAVEWLSNRLYPVVERTLKRITGNGWAAQFVVQEPTPIQRPEWLATEVAWRAPDFDPSDPKKVAGWVPVPEYGQLFWAPLLGPIAWRVWEIVRRTDHQGAPHDWTPRVRYSAPELARLVPCGKQALTGRNRQCDPDTPGAQEMTLTPLGQAAMTTWARHNPGAFDRLQQYDLAEITVSGSGRRQVYTLSVRWRLPLLHPTEVAELSAELQIRHDQWVLEHGMDPELWA